MCACIHALNAHVHPSLLPLLLPFEPRRCTEHVLRIRAQRMLASKRTCDPPTITNNCSPQNISAPLMTPAQLCLAERFPSSLPSLSPFSHSLTQAEAWCTYACLSVAVSRSACMPFGGGRLTRMVRLSPVLVTLPRHGACVMALQRLSRGHVRTHTCCVRLLRRPLPGP